MTGAALNWGRALRRWSEPACALHRDRRGIATMMMAISLMALMGVASISIDLASIYLARRQLQGITDAAAMAAANQSTPSLQRVSIRSVIDESGADNVDIARLENGNYTADAAIPIDQRFKVGGQGEAARLTLRRTVPLFFARALGFEDATVSTTSTASRQDLAAFSLGTSLATVSGGIPNQLLSALIGTNLNLSVLDSQNLVDANVDLLGFADALKARINAKDLTYAEVFNRSVSVADVVQALAGSVDNANAASLLSQIAMDAPSSDIALGDLVDLGPYGRLDYNPGTLGLKVDAYSLLRTALELSAGDHYDISLNLSVAGLAGTTVRIVGGQGTVHSPWLTVTSAKGYTLRTAQMRILVSAGVLTGSNLLPSVTVPVYVELASASASLNDIACTGDADSDGVTLGVVPSVGKVALASVKPSDMDDFTQSVPLSSATLVNVPLLARVTGLSQLDLGGVTTKTVHFTPAEVEAQTVKTVSTTDLTQGITQSLVSDIDLKVSLLGLVSLNASTVTGIVGNTLSVAAPLIDNVLFSLTDALGVKVGAAQVRVDKIRCGTPMIVA